MLLKTIPMLIALFSGVAMAVQGGINSGLAKIIGLLEATFFVHISAALLVAVLLFVLQMGQGDLIKISQVPWYLYLGGVLGVLITYGVIASIPKVGVTLATTAIIVGQVSTAMLIDHLGLFGLEKIAFSWVKLGGLFLLAAGAKLMLS